jgi:hypothetical protein
LPVCRGSGEVGHESAQRTQKREFQGLEYFFPMIGKTARLKQAFRSPPSGFFTLWV